ncbi:MAG: hypothetical protein K2X10_05310 [Hyphomicrobiales bacterium]|nr:hypothetical protein [Hyphomicrobiales bacterium]
MDKTIADRRRFLTLFAGAVAAGVTGLGLTADKAEALPVPAVPHTPPSATTDAMAPEEGIDLSKVEKVQYYYVRPRRRFYRRPRYVYVRPRRRFYRRPRRVIVYRRRPVRYYRYYRYY